MRNHEEFILGNATLHLQLSTALAVMTQLIRKASNPPTAQQLSESMDLSVRYLRKLLRTLAGGGLLRMHPKLIDVWICNQSAHEISLADIYHCLISVREEQSAPFVPVPQVDALLASSELLMMQATMSINQIVLQHLQQFDLGRLKVAESAMSYTASLRGRSGVRSTETLDSSLAT